MTDLDPSNEPSDAARIEQLVHDPPKVERTPVQKALRLASIMCSVVSLAAVGVVIIAYAQLRSCTNSGLGDPAGLQKAATAAQGQFAGAAHAFAAAVTDVFRAQPGSVAQRNAVTRLRVDSQALSDTSKTWALAVRRAYEYRIEHPIGNC